MANKSEKKGKQRWDEINIPLIIFFTIYLFLVVQKDFQIYPITNWSQFNVIAQIIIIQRFYEYLRSTTLNRLDYSSTQFDIQGLNIIIQIIGLFYDKISYLYQGVVVYLIYTWVKSLYDMQAMFSGGNNKEMNTEKSKTQQKKEKKAQKMGQKIN